MEETERRGVGDAYGVAPGCGLGQTSELLNLSKGDKVLVVGEIRYREYDDEVSKGKTRIEVKKRLSEIHTSRVERLYKPEKPEASE